jgi:sulfate adenylyltransferase large subunit
MASPLLIPDSAEQLLIAEDRKELLRFTTAGSVDDGKSTLIGRLLYDSKNVYLDQLESVTKASEGRNAGPIDFSLLTDGLRAEREQGITIDVAYRYFSTPKRKFIIADTPGHEQFTRNMVTGASTAELAIVLVDARKGLLPQSRRHAFISALLGIKRIVIAVNKMDLVGYSEEVFRQVELDFGKFLAQFEDLQPYFLPISALLGDNVVARSEQMPWFTGRSLFEHLESVPATDRAAGAPFRFPVQRVIRPDLDYRGYAGQIASGSLRPGDRVVVLPSGRASRIKSIVTFDGEKAEAQSPESVTLLLEDEIDIARGDLIARAGETIEVARSIEATLVWMSEEPLDLRKRYRLKHNTRLEWAEVKKLHHRININTLEHEPAHRLEMNEIGFIHLEVPRALYFDPYKRNRTTGAFVLIDPFSNSTVAAGMIAGVAKPAFEERASLRPVRIEERAARLKHRGAIVQLGSREGLADRLERSLFDRGFTVVRFRQWAPEWKQALLDAGLLVVVNDSALPACAIETAGSRVDFDESAALPANEVAAAQLIGDALEKAGVFVADPELAESEGI